MGDKKLKTYMGPRTVYRPKSPPNKSVTLTALAKETLTAAAARCETSESNIIEHLLRLHAGDVQPGAFAAE